MNKYHDQDHLQHYRERHIGRLLLRAHRDFSARAAELLHEHGYPRISLQHIDLLPHIDVGGTRTTVLAGRARMTKQGMGKLVAELEQQGLVKRVPDPSDGRAMLVGFTDAGMACLATAVDVVQSLEAEYLSILGQHRLDELRETLAMLGGNATNGQ